MQTYKFKSESIESGLNELDKLLLKLQKDFMLDDEMYGNILICLSEAYTNSFMYGNKAEIELRFDKKSDVIEFQLSDKGKGFNINNIPDPTDPKNIEKETGRGLFIIKSLADSVSFNQSGNCIILKFQLVSHVA